MKILPLIIEWAIPILAFIPIVRGFNKLRKFRISKANVEQKKDAKFELIIGVLVLVFSIGNNITNLAEKQNASDTLSAVSFHVTNLMDTLADTRDTLERRTNSMEKVGLKIDAKTDSIMIVNSKILGAVLIANARNNDGFPDSINYLAELKDGKLHLSPRQGVWANFSMYLDTAYFNENSLDHPASSLSFINLDPQQFKYKNRTLIMNRYYGFDPIKQDQPLVINLAKHPKQLIIFGDDASLGKRYVYENGKVTWFPE